MFFRKITTRSNGKEYTYVKLIENYRKGSQIKQRVIANLGNIEELDPARVRNLIASLAKVCGVEPPGKPKLKIKRVLRYGNVLAVHKIWERLDLSGAVSACPGGDPGLALGVELLVIAGLLRLPAEEIKEWRRHLYLPAAEQANPPPREEVFNFLAENGQRLQEQIFLRLRKWGIVTPSLYLFPLKCRVENNPAQPVHFLNRRGRRHFFNLDLLVTPAGVPAGLAATLRNPAAGEAPGERPAAAGAAAGAWLGTHRVVVAGNFPAPPAENRSGSPVPAREYIAGLPFPAAKNSGDAGEAPPGKGLPADPFPAFPSEGWQRLADDLWYQEIKTKQARRLLCSNPFQNRRLILETNLEDLPAPEIIRIYDGFTAAQARYRVIGGPGGPDWAAGNPLGLIIISWLCHLVEKLLDYVFHEQGMNMNASSALQTLEPVKIVIHEIGGEPGSSATAVDKAQRKIFAAFEAEAAPEAGAAAADAPEPPFPAMRFA